MPNSDATGDAAPKKNSRKAAKSKPRWEVRGVLIEDAMALRVAPPKLSYGGKPPGGKPVDPAK